MDLIEPSPWRILLVDDDEDDYLITLSLLAKAKGRKVSLDWAPNYEAGMASAQARHYDALLIDYDMGAHTGIELIRALASQGYPAPLILFTGRGSYEVDLEAQRAGATLYLTKSEATPLLLERSIRYAIERKQIEAQMLASQAAAVNERNQLQAVMDSLPIGVAILDAQGGNVLSNSSFEKVWGDPLPDTESIQDYAAYKAWWVDSGRPVEPQEWAAARAVLHGETVVGQFFEIERFDGTRAFVLNSAAPVFDAQGKAISSAVAIMDVSPLIKAERALQESEASYRLLFNSMLDGFALHEMIYDPQGKPVDYRFLEANPAFEELTGLKAADILGKTVLEVLPETEPYWIETYGEVVRTGRSVRFENYHQTLDKYYEVVAFRPHEGMFAVIFTDITERHRTELERQSAQEELERRVQERTSELKKANDTLESVFSSIDFLAALMDRDFNFIRVNANYACAGGREASFFAGKNYFDLYPNTENEAIFRRVVETGEPYACPAKSFEHRQDPEHGIRYYDCSLQPVKEENGQVSGLILTQIDVTEHQKAKMQLEQVAARADALAELFEQLFQSAPNATLLVDAGGKISRANRQAGVMFGYPEAELAGQPLEMLLPESLRLEHKARRPTYMEHSSIISMGKGGSFTAQRKNGQALQVEVLLSPIQVQGQPHVICVIREIPEELKHEEHKEFIKDTKNQ